MIEDLNHIVHGCTHGKHCCQSASAEDIKEAFQHVEAYVTRLVHLAAPRQLVFLAVDGVGPRAKMNQQRTRRFLGAYARQLSATFGMCCWFWEEDALSMKLTVG